MSGAPESPPPDDAPRRRPSTGRTGLLSGLLFLAVMLAAFALWWRTTGAREPDGDRPPPVPAERVP